MGPFNPMHHGQIDQVTEHQVNRGSHAGLQRSFPATNQIKFDPSPIQQSTLSFTCSERVKPGQKCPWQITTRTQNHLRVSNWCEWSSTYTKVCNRLHDVTGPNNHAMRSILSKTHSDERGNQLLLTNQELFKCRLLFCYQFDRLRKYDNDKAPSIQRDTTSMTLGETRPSPSCWWSRQMNFTQRQPCSGAKDLPNSGGNLSDLALKTWATVSLPNSTIRIDKVKVT